MHSERVTTGRFRWPHRKMVFALAVAAASASEPLSGLAPSDNGRSVSAQAYVSTSRELRWLLSTRTSVDNLPDEPMPQGQELPSRSLVPSTDWSQTQFKGRPEAGSQPLRFTRAVGIFPVEEAGSTHDSVAPLSVGQKLEFFIKPTFDPSIVAIAALGTLLSAKHTIQPAFGAGAAAYGQKAGAIAADYASHNLFAGALLPSFLHQDPRFYRKRDGSVLSRVMYGISRPFITRTDDGLGTLNTSYLGGLTMTVALSNVYYPDCNRNARDSALRYGEGVGLDAVVNVIREFLKLTH